VRNRFENIRYYAASTGNFLSTFRDNIAVKYSRVKKSTFSRKVGADLPLCAV